ncbi:hypothetical protein SAMN04487898_108169 [Pedobacter sp. ok626]|uniref:hypothetical protein n=1 Tax=Pedobacter sp. ok626 TaxID=1761882 RepID=UPI0008816E61|nr:hypothetical protein [Pedobacter sp. ok626]SDK43880.1 hypothetical protein SAMN04487898_108169 [Pedobacter sp. ok626]
MVFIVIVILSFLLQMVLPWWIIIIISFVTCGLIGKTGKIALWAPFFAILLLWTAIALFKTLPNDNILATRVAQMFGIQDWWLILVLTALLGAFTAGVSGFCGYHFRKAVLVTKTNP